MAATAAARSGLSVILLEARSIGLHFADDELARRRERLSPLRSPAGCGWLSVCARSVSPLHRGATLGG